VVSRIAAEPNDTGAPALLELGFLLWLSRMFFRLLGLDGFELRDRVPLASGENQDKTADQTKIFHSGGEASREPLKGKSEIHSPR
jgi:hypothetical protein